MKYDNLIDAIQWGFRFYLVLDCLVTVSETLCRKPFLCVWKKKKRVLKNSLLIWCFHMTVYNGDKVISHSSLSTSPVDIWSTQRMFMGIVCSQNLTFMFISFLCWAVEDLPSLCSSAQQTKSHRGGAGVLYSSSLTSSGELLLCSWFVQAAGNILAVVWLEWILCSSKI